MSIPGILFSVTMKSLGSSESSKSSTIACLMLILLSAIIDATSATIPGMLGSFGIISITPQFISDATSFRWHVGVRFENTFFRSSVFIIVSIVLLIILLSISNALAIFESDISMSLQ